MRFTHIPYKETHAFSQLVIDYLDNKEKVQTLFQFGFDEDGVKKAIENRKLFPVDRSLLCSVLKHQYADVKTDEKLQLNMALLLKENTFTVCTAHQPNLFTGYLYFVYKIVHAIKLSKVLKEKFPEQNFVPVYYMGSEDNDLDELGVFHFGNQTFRWDANGQHGAFGRMKTESLSRILDDLFKILGPPGTYCEELKDLLTNAYLKKDTIADATLYLVNELFGKYGLIVLNPDDRKLKSTFIEIMKDDLLHHTPFQLKNQSTLNSFKEQAHTREINLFYLTDNIRERIEKYGDKWKVNNTNIIWNKEELLSELAQHPERFSPNVILRGLYQETILPNVVFIGGGSEVAYWFQLKKLFEHYQVCFPSIHLRQSVLIVSLKAQKLIQQVSFSLTEIFQTTEKQEKIFIEKQCNGKWQLIVEKKYLKNLLETIKKKATDLDPTLSASSETALIKMQRQMHVLETKMLRAEKRKLSEQFVRIKKLNTIIFPSGTLQERRENFMPWYLLYGGCFIEILFEQFDPFRHEFLVFEEDN